MKAHLTRGILAAVLTPLDDDGEACLPMLIEHGRRLLDAGCDGIVLLGTTGEANSFTCAERQAILERSTSGGLPASKLIVGTGCCAAGDTITLTAHALSLGVARVLMLPPFYYKGVDERGIVDAYARVIDGVGDDHLRVYLYQIPQLSGVDIASPVIDALLARYPDIVAGIKDSSGDRGRIADLCRRFGNSFDVLVGNERFLSAALAEGACGCVTATANVFAEPICALFESRDAALEARVIAARAVFEAYPMIAGLKACVARRTGGTRWLNLRPPLTGLSQSESDALVFACEGAFVQPAP